jgi:L-arabinokinase
VISDVVPVACRVAADVGIPSVCIGNFSWDYIYAEYIVASGDHHRSIVWQVCFFPTSAHYPFLLRVVKFWPLGYLHYCLL